ncbi:MAG: bifunctional folylpolyglutamate synthase/dihydrofolate synthase, partial [Streptosporangiaceae bacterium]
VDRDHENPLSFFEIMTGMAFAAFADAPVDAQVLEVGLGGRWDSTNVADAKVAVITPVAVDHARYLGSTPVEIAAEKAGIMKPSSIAVLAQQDPDVAEVLLRRSVELGVTVAREGFEFGVTEREVAVGGQMLGLHGLRGDYDQVFLPLHGAHQAHNAACALAAVEAFVAGLGAQEETLDPELVREGFAQVTSPGRLELVRRSPAVVVDAAHNPHGAEATAQAVGEAFAFSPLIGVLAVMEDKDALGLLEAFEPVLDRVVITRNATPRAMAVEELAEIAREVFGEDRVETALRLDDAIDLACRLAESESSALGSGGVLVSGSVVTAGEARKLLGAG